VAIDILRVEWTAAPDACVASFAGPVDDDSLDVIIAIAVYAKEVDRVVVDLSCVTAADGRGIELLERLSNITNVGITNPSPAIVHALEKIGGLGL
jgi:hypothetical protein